MSRATSTPNIPIHDKSQKPRYPTGRSPSYNSSYTPDPTPPMSVRDSYGRDKISVPPPLLPPRHIGEQDLLNDTSFKLQNTGGIPTGRAPRAGSSLYGHPPSSQSIEKPSNAPERSELSFPRRSSSSFMSGDSETYSGIGREKSGLKMPSIDSTPFQSQAEQQLGQKTHQTSSNAYDKQLLSKIGGPNTGATKQPKLETPDLSYPSTNNSSSRWTSEISSPGSNGIGCPNFETVSGDSTHLPRFGRISSDEGRRHAGSYDSGIFQVDNDPAMDEKEIQGLNINERSPNSDHYPSRIPKQRVASPLGEGIRDDRPVGNGGSEQHYVRPSQPGLGSHSSSASRYSSGPGSSSIGSASTASSYSQHQGSYSSAYAISVASSATSFGERLSPISLDAKGILSPIDAELGPVSPYAANRSPRGSLARGPPPPAPQHPRGPSDHDPTTHGHSRKMSQENLVHSRHSTGTKVQGPYICECCPKKPKKFETEDELRTHELEKQYTCLYCPNRFKNKNEAERHQNSLHLRRHSWSCAALAGVHAAYHPSTAHSSNNDVCGYCGEEFPNPANMKVRGEHLNHIHKFGECNQAKKFFRADHFRQHLKHSHAGTSGKWTNQLENACMKEERAPEGMMSAATGTTSKPGVITEVHNES